MQIRVAKKCRICHKSFVPDQPLHTECPACHKDKKAKKRGWNKIF